MNSKCLCADPPPLKSHLNKLSVAQSRLACKNLATTSSLPFEFARMNEMGLSNVRNRASRHFQSDLLCSLSQ